MSANGRGQLPPLYLDDEASKELGRLRGEAEFLFAVGQAQRVAKKRDFEQRTKDLIASARLRRRLGLEAPKEPDYAVEREERRKALAIARATARYIERDTLQRAANRIEQHPFLVKAREHSERFGKPLEVSKAFVRDFHVKLWNSYVREKRALAAAGIAPRPDSTPATSPAIDLKTEGRKNVNTTTEKTRLAMLAEAANEGVSGAQRAYAEALEGKVAKPAKPLSEHAYLTHARAIAKAEGISIAKAITRAEQEVPALAASFRSASAAAAGARRS